MGIMLKFYIFTCYLLFFLPLPYLCPPTPYLTFTTSPSPPHLHHLTFTTSPSPHLHHTLIHHLTFTIPSFTTSPSPYSHSPPHLHHTLIHHLTFTISSFTTSPSPYPHSPPHLHHTLIHHLTFTIPSFTTSLSQCFFPLNINTISFTFLHTPLPGCKQGLLIVLWNWRLFRTHCMSS